MQTLTARTLFQTLSQEAKEYHYILIEGMPGVGKAALVDSVFRDLSRLDLHDLHPRNLATTQPSVFFEVYGKSLAINHIECAPDLINHLPAPEDGVFVVMTGYLPEEAKLKLLETGAAKVYRLMPLSQRELSGMNAVPFGKTHIPITMSYPTVGLFDTIRNGFLPRPDAMVSNSAFYESWLAEFFNNHVRGVLRVAKDTRFYDYMKALAAANMQEINHYQLAKQAHISYGTAMYWTRFLIESGVLFEVPSLKLSTRRQVKRAKVAYTDSGLLCHLLDIRDSQALLTSEHYPGIFAGFCAAEIMKGYYAHGLDAPLYFYRDTARRHIELVIARPQSLLPLAFLSKRCTPMKAAIREMDVLVRMGERRDDPVFISDATETIEQTTYAIVSASNL